MINFKQLKWTKVKKYKYYYLGIFNEFNNLVCIEYKRLFNSLSYTEYKLIISCNDYSERIIFSSLHGNNIYTVKQQAINICNLLQEQGKEFKL